MKLQLPLSKEDRLVRWANGIAAFYYAPVYIVGSQITGKANPRDVDIICVISDNDFQLRYGFWKDWYDEGISGQYSHIRWSWAADCAKKSLHGMGETKMSIDFKVQPKSHWEEFAGFHNDYPPYRLDTMPDSVQTPERSVATTDVQREETTQPKNSVGGDEVAEKQEESHEDSIKCPECGIIQTAIVKHTYPFWTWWHECESCKYMIMESEWDSMIGKNPTVKVSDTTQAEQNSERLPE